MKILIACLSHAYCTGRQVAEAMRRLGHDVRRIGWELGGIEAPRQYAWSWCDGEFDAYWPDWTPDLVIYAETAFKPWHHGYYKAAPHVLVCNCNHVVNLRMEGMARYFLAARYSECWPVAQPDEEWWPCAYDRALHTPSAIPWQDRQYDVCLIGRYNGKYLRYFQEAKLNVFHSSNGYWLEDYRNVYHNSRISLCIAPPGILSLRYFETAAMGNLVIGTKVRELDDLHPQGLVLVESAAEALERGQYYLAHPEEAQAMVAQSQAWVAPHHYDNRSQQIVDWYEREYST